MTTATAYQFDYPPSINSYYRHVMFGKAPRVLISKPGREYKEHVKRVLGDVEPLTGRLMVSIQLERMDNRACDIDNYVKPLLDSLEAAGLFLNDNQIDQLVVKRGPKFRFGRVTVLVEEITDVV